MADQRPHGGMASLTPVTSRRSRIIIFRLLLLAAIFLNSIVALLVLQQKPLQPLPLTPPAQTPSPQATQQTTPLAAISPAPTVAAKPTIGPVGITGRMRGLNVPVWGPDFTIASPSLSRAARINANMVALVSHWYVKSAVPYVGDGIFREEGSAGTGNNRTASDASLAQEIDDAHSNGLAVMLKPHIDWTQGGWRGWFYFDNDAARNNWWSSYSDMISSTVKLALDHNVEMICIGTEFDEINKEFASAAHWQAIIKQIRDAGYTGKLTYAANWGPYNDAEYDRAGLQGVWEQLDYVGVDAYYPISLEKDPTLDQLIAGWTSAISPYDPNFTQNNFAQLERLHRRTGKDVIFTEIGYPATDYTGKDPASGGDNSQNDDAQARAAQAVYAVWNNVDWWQGLFWWQDGPTFNSLSIAGRPAEDVLSQQWQKDKLTAQGKK